jgi:hypothetical protein
MIRRGLLAAALCALAACDAMESPTLPATAAPPETPSRLIVDGQTWGATGFFFRLWSLPAPTTTGTFDAGLSPVVEICRVTNGSCGATLASFSKTSGSYGRRVTVNTTDQLYEVVWPTASTGATAGQVYRIRARVGTRELGYVDVKMVTSVWEFFTIDYAEYVPWVAGRELEIPFRIDTGIPGSITLSASSLTVGVGEAVTLTAQLRDLRGQPIATPAEWWLQNTSAAAGPVVEVDSGWVVGQNAGTGSLMAWYDDIEVSIPVTVTDNRRAWQAVLTPDDQGIRALWGSGAAPTFAAGHAGVLRHDGAAWQYVDAVRWRATHDVAGLGTSVWVAGDDGTLLRYDGAAWSAVRYNGTTVAPLALDDWSVPATRIALRALWAASSTTLFAAGDGGTLLRYNGTAWTVVPTGVTADLTDVWGTSATNVYLTTSDGRVLRYDGSSVTPVSAVQAPGALNAVWGSAANNVYAVGAGGLVYRFNGTAWSRVRLPTRAALYDVWGSSASAVYVGGEAGIIYRWDGTKWTPEKSSGGGRQVLALWGNGTNVYAAGAGGLITRR